MVSRRTLLKSLARLSLRATIGNRFGLQAVVSAVEATPAPDAEYIRLLIPKQISGEYRGGRVRELQLAGRLAYVVEPTGPVDPDRRWIWEFPFWLGINDGHGVLHHRWYVEQFLERGFHVAGIDVGTSCGSPRAAAICQKFHTLLTDRHGLNPRARLLVQSNGGLIGYGWGFRNSQCVERIGGICPATDFRTWPGLPNVIQFPETGLDYGLSLEELTANADQYNPIELLRPLASSGVEILHLHGDADDVVPLRENSLELFERYSRLGGSARVVVIARLGHGGRELYESPRLRDFLLAEGGRPGAGQPGE